MKLFGRKRKQGEAPVPREASYSSLRDLLQAEMTPGPTLRRTLVLTPQGKVALYSRDGLLLGANHLGLYRALRVRLSMPAPANPLAEYEGLRAIHGGERVQEVYRDATVGALLHLDSLFQNNKLSCVSQEVTPATAALAQGWTFAQAGPDKLMAWVKEAEAVEHEAIYKLGLLTPAWLHTPVTLRRKPAQATEAQAYLLTLLEKPPFTAHQLMNNPQGFLSAHLLKALVTFLEEGVCGYSPGGATALPPEEVLSLPPVAPTLLEEDDEEDEEELARQALPGVTLAASPRDLGTPQAEQFHPVPYLLPHLSQEEVLQEVAPLVERLTALEEELLTGETPLEEESNRYLQEVFTLNDRRLGHDLRELQNDEEGPMAPSEREGREDLLSSPRRASHESFQRLLALEEARAILLAKRAYLLEEVEATHALTGLEEDLLRRKLAGAYDIPTIAYETKRG